MPPTDLDKEDKGEAAFDAMSDPIAGHTNSRSGCRGEVILTCSMSYTVAGQGCQPTPSAVGVGAPPGSLVRLYETTVFRAQATRRENAHVGSALVDRWRRGLRAEGE